MPLETNALSQQNIIPIVKKERSGWIKLSHEMHEYFLNKRLDLLREQQSHLRNTIIVAGTLVTIGLLILNNSDQSLKGLIATPLLIISIMVLLLVILFLSSGLFADIESASDYLKDAEKKTTDIPEQLIKLSNDVIDNRISHEVFAIEREKLIERGENDFIKNSILSKKESRFIIFLIRTGQILFLVGIGSLILSLVYNSLLHLTKLLLCN